MQTPLEGRTIVITRAISQSREFAERLEQLGARVVACPTIEIVAPDSFDALDDAIESLYGYDWVIFTSANGVDAFIQRLRHLEKNPSELDEVHVCAIGDATAERLSMAQIHVDVIPAQFKAEGVYAALIDYLGGVEKLTGLTFLLPRAAVARDFLPAALENSGARVDVVTAYKTIAPHSTDKRRIETLLAGGGVDCITFTSSSTVNNLADMFGSHDLDRLLAGVKVACIGDITAATVERHGLRCDIIPKEFTVPSLADAIASYFSEN